MNMHSAVSRPVSGLRGDVVAPGDKSCSHRALILGALARGNSCIDGLLESEDVAATRRAMQAIGARCERVGPGRWDLTGAVPARAPSAPLDMGNSGTSTRLIMGVVASLGLQARFIGDASLSRRPMERVLIPLRRMGAICTSADGKLPVDISAKSPLTAIEHVSEQASAQVKSAVLLAGLGAEGVTSVVERVRTRDHTETMLAAFGVEVGRRTTGAGYCASVTGGQELKPNSVTIAGDPSSAAFLWSAALIAADAEVAVNNVMDHPDRSGLTELARSMGADLSARDTAESSGERTVGLLARSSSLRAASPGTIAAMIDELPLFAVLAAYAEGTSVVRGASELRHKESDRIRTTVQMLRGNGVAVEEFEDGFAVQGCGGPPPGGGHVEARGDHRIAMSALVLGCGARAPVSVDDISVISTSYPAFLDDMARIGADIRA